MSCSAKSPTSSTIYADGVVPYTDIAWSAQGAVAQGSTQVASRLIKALVTIWLSECHCNFVLRYVVI